MNLDYRGVRPHLNVGGLLDLVDEVARHGCRERVATDQHHHLGRILRKVKRGLTGRIRAAHYVHGFALAGDRLLTSAAVIDARALHPVHPGNIKFSPLHSGSDEHGVTGNLVAIAEFQDAVRTLCAQFHDFLRRQNLHSEALRLHHRSARQIAAAQT